MRIFSLVFAAAVFLGLASSANADAVHVVGNQAHNVLTEGEVLFATECQDCSPVSHRFTVRYDGQIYACNVNLYTKRESLGDWYDIVDCYTDNF